MCNGVEMVGFSRLGVAVLPSLAELRDPWILPADKFPVSPPALAGKAVTDTNPCSNWRVFLRIEWMSSQQVDVGGLRTAPGESCWLEEDFGIFTCPLCCVCAASAGAGPWGIGFISFPHLPFRGIGLSEVRRDPWGLWSATPYSFQDYME